MRETDRESEGGKERKKESHKILTRKGDLERRTGSQTERCVGEINFRI